jgi:hypothetical protein
MTTRRAAAKRHPSVPFGVRCRVKRADLDRVADSPASAAKTGSSSARIPSAGRSRGSGSSDCDWPPGWISQWSEWTRIDVFLCLHFRAGANCRSGKDAKCSPAEKERSQHAAKRARVLERIYFMPGGWHGREGLRGQRGRGLSGRLETHQFDRTSALVRLANVPPLTRMGAIMTSEPANTPTLPFCTHPLETKATTRVPFLLQTLLMKKA